MFAKVIFAARIELAALVILATADSFGLGLFRTYAEAIAACL